MTRVYGDGGKFTEFQKTLISEIAELLRAALTIYYGYYGYYGHSSG
jgi:hypothetical protein